MADALDFIAGSFSSTGQTDALQLREVGEQNFTTRIRGTFTGLSAQVEVKRPGEADSAYTLVEQILNAASTAIVKNGRLYGAWDVRINVTAISSGTGEVLLVAG